MKKIILLFGLFFSCFAFSQGENNNWYFGNKAAITFNTAPPSALTDSEMNMLEGVATISKPNGELLFYTNGNIVWNREHQVMTNGTELNASQTTQQVLILPHPGNANLYYIFTMSNHHDLSPPPVSTKVSYSVVDMSLGDEGEDGKPLGVVTEDKNIILKKDGTQDLDYYTEAVTAVLHSDNQSYWVLIPNGTKLYSYRLNSTGFVNNPVSSNLPFTHPFSGQGQIKASPNLSPELPYSNLIAITIWDANDQNVDRFKVLSFDNSTGELTNHYELTLTSMLEPPFGVFYSSEFNYDGTLLYIAKFWDGKMYKIDLEQEDIEEIFAGSFMYQGRTLQRGIDNNIYFARQINPVLNIISNPDSFIDASFDPYNNIYLEGKTSQSGLPQLIPLYCKENLTLYSPEVSYKMLYEASNTITTHQSYKADLDKDITLSAGNMVEILPDSHIEGGSVFLAVIEGCEGNIANAKSMTSNKNIQPRRIIINLDEVEMSDFKLTIYPNPAKDVININSTTAIENVTITDMNGRIVKNITLGVNEGQINIADLSQGVYILNAVSNGKSVTEKIIKR